MRIGSGGRRGRIVGRIRGVHSGANLVVQQGEGLSGELQPEVLVKGDVARDAEVEVIEARPDDAVAADLRRTAAVVAKPELELMAPP
jgi:hypothetical protein